MADGYKADFNNFLYPLFRNALLTGYVGLQGASTLALGDIRTSTSSKALKICFLNAGVGTQYSMPYATNPGVGVGGGTTQYAWNPALSGQPVLPGYGISSMANIPQSHRTMSNLGGVANWGGNAITTTLSGVGVSYSGVLFADNVTTYQVTAGTMVSAFVLYQWNRVNNGGGTADTALEDASSPLIAYFDCATGMPVQGNGGDITVVWDTGANKIFKI